MLAGIHLISIEGHFDKKKKHNNITNKRKLIKKKKTFVSINGTFPQSIVYLLNHFLDQYHGTLFGVYQIESSQYRTFCPIGNNIFRFFLVLFKRNNRKANAPFFKFAGKRCLTLNKNNNNNIINFIRLYQSKSETFNFTSMWAFLMLFLLHLCRSSMPLLFNQLYNTATLMHKRLFTCTRSLAHDWNVMFLKHDPHMSALNKHKHEMRWEKKL